MRLCGKALTWDAYDPEFSLQCAEIKISCQVVVHAVYSPGRQRQDDRRQFKASMVYTVSSRPARLIK